MYLRVLEGHGGRATGHAQTRKRGAPPGRGGGGRGKLQTQSSVVVHAASVINNHLLRFAGRFELI